MATGSAVESDHPCWVCGEARGVVYDGPVYGRDSSVVCLVCIATGDASVALAIGEDRAEFTDVGWGVPDGVPEHVLDEVRYRTPGFTGWQQEHWLYHCNDAAAFQGRVGSAELAGMSDAVAMLLQEYRDRGWSAEVARDYLESLDRDGESTAYWFRCVICGRDLAYSDAE